MHTMSASNFPGTDDAISFKPTSAFADSIAANSFTFLPLGPQLSRKLQVMNVFFPCMYSDIFLRWETSSTLGITIESITPDFATSFMHFSRSSSSYPLPIALIRISLSIVE